MSGRVQDRRNILVRARGRGTNGTARRGRPPVGESRVSLEGQSMPRIRIEVSRDLAVPPQAAYRVIADYRAGHPRIIPPRAFRDLTVERGGVGAGTIIRFRMRIGGVEREYRATVTEPEPGRVLVETNDSGEVST